MVDPAIPMPIRRLRAIEIRQRGRQLARLLDFDPSSFNSRDEAALLILARLAIMPLERDHDRRPAYGNEIMSNADRILPSTEPANTAFWQSLRTQVILMQEFPDWYHKFSDNNNELVRAYWWLNLEINVLGWLGMGSLASPSGGIVRGGLQGGLQASGRGLSAVVGGGARGAATGAVRSATGGFGPRLAAVWIIGSVLYLGGRQERDAMRRELQRRYSEGRLSEEDLRRALDDDEPLPASYRYTMRR